jgi:hypothetical protein
MCMRSNIFYLELGCIEIKLLTFYYSTNLTPFTLTIKLVLYYVEMGSSLGWTNGVKFHRSNSNKRENTSITTNMILSTTKKLT